MYATRNNEIHNSFRKVKYLNWHKKIDVDCEIAQRYQLIEMTFISRLSCSESSTTLPFLSPSTYSTKPSPPPPYSIELKLNITKHTPPTPVP